MTKTFWLESESTIWIQGSLIRKFFLETRMLLKLDGKTIDVSQTYTSGTAYMARQKVGKKMKWVRHDAWLVKCSSILLEWGICNQYAVSF